MKTIAVNGRFLTQVTTGVQRYARELLVRLPAHLPHRLRVIVPPALDLSVEEALDQAAATGRWSGINGHRWEQLRLPRLLGGAELLLSPCNWGPLLVRRQVVLIYDLAPLRHPELYDRLYVLQTRHLQSRLARRVARVATISDFSRRELRDGYGIPEESIDLVPAGVGPPFTGVEPTTQPRGYCLFVGAHDPRKNLAFLLSLWEEVHARTGLRLRVVRRAASLPHSVAHAEMTPGTELVVDPDDDELAELYRNAVCVLWPSIYEGFGLPLLEGMTAGTPFLSTDVGAARELAVDPERQLLPLRREAWIEGIARFAIEPAGALRSAVAKHAEAFTWDVGAAQLAASINRALEQ
jgi:glycosyltransferase involved in cell wall biosynthesis